MPDGSASRIQLTLGVLLLHALSEPLKPYYIFRLPLSTSLGPGDIQLI